MPETKMAPEKAGNDSTELLERIAQLESEIMSHRRDGRLRGEESFRLLADAAPIMIWIADADARCTYFNKSWLEFRGRSLEQEMGAGWVEGVHPDDHDLFIATHSKCFEARKPFRMEYRLQRADGEYRWLEATGVPRLENNAFCGFL